MAARASDPARIRERKVKLDGAVQEFDLELLFRDARVVVGRYRPRGGASPGRLPIALPPGSTSDGFFWAARPYVVYRFRDAAGVLLGHRIDAASTRLGAARVSFRDLVLDWWVLPGGAVIEEDAEQFSTAVAAGRLSAADRKRAARAARVARYGFGRLARELDALEAAARRQGSPHGQRPQALTSPR